MKSHQRLTIIILLSNPGSKYYDDFVDTWANGKYNKLWVMKEEEAGDKRIIGKIIFSKS